MSDPHEDDVLASFISAEIARPEDTSGQDEMRARLAASLGLSQPAPSAGEPPSPLVKRAVSVASRLKALAILAVGFGAGFTTHAVWAPHGAPPAQVAVAPPLSSSIALLPVPVSASPPALDPSSLPRADVPSAPPSAAPRAVHSSVVADVEAERLLLETARAAMRRGDGAGALAKLREHEARFPSGQLREERDGMTVSALGMLGRTEEAEAAAARFRKRYPMSLQGAALPHPDAGK